MAPPARNEGVRGRGRGRPPRRGRGRGRGVNPAPRESPNDPLQEEIAESEAPAVNAQRDEAASVVGGGPPANDAGIGAAGDASRRAEMPHYELPPEMAVAVQACCAGLLQELRDTGVLPKPNTTAEPSRPTVATQEAVVEKANLTPQPDKWLAAFRKTGAPNFTGALGSDVNQWLRRITSDLETIQAPEERKVSLVQSLLQGDAFDWWYLNHDRRSKVTFEEFQEKIRDRYCPPSLRAAQDAAFRDAGPDLNLTIAETIQKFQQEMAAVPNAAPTEEIKITTFMKRLQPHMRSYLAGLRLKTLKDVQESALAYAVANPKTGPSDARTSVSKKQKVSSSPDYRRDNRQGQITQQRLSFQLPSRLSQNQSGQNTRGLRECFNCGGTDHLKNQCPKSPRTCYVCGKPGHLKQYCRIEAPSQGSSPGSVNQGARRPPQQPQTTPSTGKGRGAGASTAGGNQPRMLEMRRPDALNAPIATGSGKDKGPLMEPRQDDETGR